MKKNGERNEKKRTEIARRLETNAGQDTKLISIWTFLSHEQRETT